MKKTLPIITLILISATLVFGQAVFTNKKIGFSMQEPKNWFVITNEQLKENLQNFEIPEKVLAESAKTSKTTVLLTAYVKYESRKNSELNPKIQIDIRPNPTKDFQKFESSVIRNAEVVGKAFENFEFIQKPSETVVSGIKSMFFIGKFSIKTQGNGRELKVRVRVYAIPYKNYFFQVNFVDGQIEEDNSKLFDELLKTIKIGD